MYAFTTHTHTAAALARIGMMEQQQRRALQGHARGIGAKQLPQAVVRHQRRGHRLTRHGGPREAQLVGMTTLALLLGHRLATSTR